MPILSSQINLVLKYLDESCTGFVDREKFQKIRKMDDQQLLKISLTTSLFDPVKEDDGGKTGKGSKKKKGKSKTKTEDTVKVKPVIDRYVEFEPRLVRLGRGSGSNYYCYYYFFPSTLDLWI